jgi:hypothetical protein
MTNFTTLLPAQELCSLLLAAPLARLQPLLDRPTKRCMLARAKTILVTLLSVDSTQFPSYVQMMRIKSTPG